MKIRIKGNSLRYRLTQRDVDKFSADGYIEETTDFGAQTLTYALQQNRLSNLSAMFEKNKITLFMPKIMANEWWVTDRVGFESRENGLHILIERILTVWIL